jgi:hypothetical protein
VKALALPDFRKALSSTGALGVFKNPDARVRRLSCTRLSWRQFAPWQRSSGLKLRFNVIDKLYISDKQIDVMR